jgi:hypothetical protein
MFAPLLPRISNLKFGFLYDIGPNLRTSRANVDYVLPVNLGLGSVGFGEFHGEYQDFWRKPQPYFTAAPGTTLATESTSNRVDLSAGGGFRRLVGERTFVGVNGFFDTSRIYGSWYSSGGVGLEYAANISGSDAVDLNLNWYGNLFSRNGLVNAFRNEGTSYDVEAGYSHALFEQALDLRLKAAGYSFNTGSSLYGWRVGADLTTRDNVFSLRYEHGEDKINGAYDTVGGFVSVGFQLENLAKGETPFTAPEPVFKSPRNLAAWLTQGVKRNWHQPSSVVVAKSTAVAAGGNSLTRTFPNPFPMTAGPGIFTTIGGTQSFTDVPFASLSPTGNITVSFDYDFSGFSPTVVASFAVSVYDSTLSRRVDGAIALLPAISPSGHIGPITLNLGSGTPFPNQNAFVSTGTNPSRISIAVVTVNSAPTLTISNVQIVFNQ